MSTLLLFLVKVSTFLTDHSNIRAVVMVVVHLSFMDIVWVNRARWALGCY